MDNDSNNITDFSKVGLTPYMMPIGAPITKPGPLGGASFDMQNEVQARFIRASLVNIKRFIDLSGTDSAAGTFGNGGNLFLSTTLDPTPLHQNDVNFANTYIAIYQGTAVVSANQIYPTVGGNITPGAYTVQGGYDFNSYTQVNTSWTGVITNNSAGNQSILFVSQHKFVVYNNGTVA